MEQAFDLNLFADIFQPEKATLKRGWGVTREFSKIVYKNTLFTQVFQILMSLIVVLL